MTDFAPARSSFLAASRYWDSAVSISPLLAASITFLICVFMEDFTDLLRAVRTLSWRSRFDALRVLGITLKSARDLYFRKLTIH